MNYDGTSGYPYEWTGPIAPLWRPYWNLPDIKVIPGSVPVIYSEFDAPESQTKPDLIDDFMTLETT